MAKFKITAPDGSFSGVVGGVQFRDGVAEVESPSAALSYCRRRGYTVEPVGDDKPKPRTRTTKKSDE